MEPESETVSVKVRFWDNDVEHRKSDRHYVKLEVRRYDRNTYKLRNVKDSERQTGLLVLSMVA